MTAMEHALKTALASKPTTLVVKSETQRIWEWLKDHPNQRSRDIEASLKLKPENVSSILNSMTKRGMVLRVAQPVHKTARMVWSYQVNPKMRFYELWPLPLPPKEVPASAGAMYVNMVPLPAPVPVPAPAPSAVAVHAPTNHKAYVEGLTIAEARNLYKELHELFGK